MELLPTSLRLSLEQRYREPGRHYHAMAHVTALLGLLQRMRDLATAPELIEAAIWFHDAVYDPHSSCNELDSAVLARQELGALGWPAARVERVAQLVLATATHQAAADDADALLFLDLDLSILGQSAVTYAGYTAQIRAEYAWVEEAAYRAGRSRVLANFLARPSIYFTPRCRDLWEANARSNVQAELAQLAPPAAVPP